MDTLLTRIQKVLQDGVSDDDCHLSKLRGCPHLLKAIWTDVESFWKNAIILPHKRSPDVEDDFNSIKRGKKRVKRHVQPCVFSKENQDSFPSWLYLAPIRQNAFNSFPEPTDIKINMMPFIAGQNFQDCRLPDYLEPYWPMIRACLKPEIMRHQWNYWPKNILESDLGKVYYLTIEESFVEAGSSQRRPGLHVDRPGDVKLRRGKGAGHGYYGHRWGSGCAHITGVQRTPGDTEWFDFDDGDDLDGNHHGRDILYGGIYLATSLAQSCRAWNCGVAPEVLGRLGDISHLRAGLPGPGTTLEPNTLYWITDRTPHESLPLSESGYRQFFRLVTSEVSLWYKDHSTPNPLGVEPDPKVTKVVVGDKFSDEGVEVVE